jgi:L-2,4-diaminobutyric acid acetyltransferase
MNHPAPGGEDTSENRQRAGLVTRAPTRPSEPGAGLPVLVGRRPPNPEDAAAVWGLVRDSGALDLNSPYAYLLLCSDFADTCVVAEAAGRVVGFVGAYRPPPRPDSLFVWQIVTARELRGAGLGRSLLDSLFLRPACRSVRFLEATVTASNDRSRALFAGFARRRGLPLVELPAFGPELFPAADHEEEVRVRIGPLAAPTIHPEGR